MRICLFLLATLVTITSTFGKEKENPPKIEEKLKIIIPKFKQKATIEEVLAALRDESIKNDPDKKGVSIIYRKGQEKVKDKNFNFDFENMPTGEIIRYICIASGLKYKVDKHAVIIAAKNIQIDELVTRFYPVDPSIASLFTELGVQNYFEALGVSFDAGAQIAYLKSVSRLVVTNTPNNHKKIQEIFKALNSETPSIETQISIMRHKLNDLNQDLNLLESLVKEKGKKHEFADINKKLQLVLPKVRFEDGDFDLVLDFLKRRTRDLDHKGEGLNIIFSLNDKHANLGKVNLDADDIPVGEIIKYICNQLKLKYKVEKHAVIISK